MGLIEKEYTLLAGEQWDHFEVRACSGMFTGINAVTNKKTGVSCGPYGEADGCVVKTLTADKGYHIIGLYGDGNGIVRTKDQGFRGLGLITIEDGH